VYLDVYLGVGRRFAAYDQRAGTGIVRAGFGDDRGRRFAGADDDILRRLRRVGFAARSHEARRQPAIPRVVSFSDRIVGGIVAGGGLLHPHVLDRADREERLATRRAVHLDVQHIPRFECAVRVVPERFDTFGSARLYGELPGRALPVARLVLLNDLDRLTPGRQVGGRAI